MNQADQSRSSGSSAERSLRLLSRLASEGKALSLAQLATDLTLPKATVHRICGFLLDGGFISKSDEGRAFEIGPALRRLALDTLNHDTTQGLRHTVLEDLVAQIGETCNFTTLDGADVRYLDRVEAKWPWRLTLEVGAHVPIHCTASGKLFIALMDAPRREQMLKTLVLNAMTEHTITDVEKLRSQCATIAAQGYALDEQEFIDGLIAMAVPVFDANQTLRGAVAVHAPMARMSAKGALTHLPALRAASLRMGPLL